MALSGWYVPSRNGAAVVLLHGAGSTRSAVLAHAVVLADHGFGVLLYDARGHGRSQGRAMDFGWYGDLDVAAAVDFVAGRSGVQPGKIAAVGLSMGGEEALGAAACDPRIRAVVAEGATTRVAGDKAWLSDVHGVRGWVQEQLDRAMYATADVLTAASPPVRCATPSPAPARGRSCSSPPERCPTRATPPRTSRPRHRPPCRSGPRPVRVTRGPSPCTRPNGRTESSPSSTTPSVCREP